RVRDRGGRTIAEAPAPGDYSAVRVGTGAREATGKPRATLGKSGRGRRVRRRHRDALRRGAGAAAVVGRSEIDGVRAARGIRVRRVRDRGGGTIAEAPAPADHAAIGVGAGAREGTGQPGAALREGGGGR